MLKDIKVLDPSTCNFLSLQIKVDDEKDETLEQEWNAQESDLDGIVNIHNLLFGSIDLVRKVSLKQQSNRSACIVPALIFSAHSYRVVDL